MKMPEACCEYKLREFVAFIVILYIRIYLLLEIEVIMSFGCCNLGSRYVDFFSVRKVSV